MGKIMKKLLLILLMLCSLSCTQADEQEIKAGQVWKYGDIGRHVEMLEVG